MRKSFTNLLFLLILFLLAGAFSAKADHMVGSDLKWKCLGGDTFQVTLTDYRDCNGIDFVNSPIVVTSKDCQSSITQTVSGGSSGGEDITPVCPGHCTRCHSNKACEFPFGIEQYFITYTVVLNSKCCNYIISWNQCCRSDGITTGASWNDYYIETEINRCVKPCDNSPYFTNPPVAIYCKNQCVVYNQGGNDIDQNDYLVFKLVEPLQHPGTAVNWGSNFSYKEPLTYEGFPKHPDAEWSPPQKCGGFRLDSATGELRFKPTKEEVTVLAIGVEEWRKDSSGKYVKIGEIRRDLQIIIIECPDDRPPVVSGIDGTSNTVAHFCVGQSKCFTVASFDPDKNDTVRLSWNKQIPRATFTIPDAEKKKKWPKGTFCWEPGKGDLRPYPYRFVVTGLDNACPVPGRTSKTFTIYVHPSPEIKTRSTVKDCGTVDLEGVNIGKVAIDRWQWGGDPDPILIATGSKISWKWRDTGWHHYNLTATNLTTGCFASVLDSVYIKPYVQVNLPKDTTLCYGKTLTIDSKRALGKAPFFYEWTKYIPGNTPVTIKKGYDSASVNATVTKDVYYVVKITDGIGCSNTDSMLVRVQLPPKPELGPDLRRCKGEIVWLKSGVANAKTNEWYRSNNGSLSLLGSKDSWPVTDEGVYDVHTTDSLGCDAWDSVRIYFNPLVKVTPQLYKTCKGDPIKMTAKAGPGAKYFKWVDTRYPGNPALSTDSFYTAYNVSPPGGDTSRYISYRVYAQGDTVGGLSCWSSDLIKLKVNLKPTVDAGTLPAQCQDNPPMSLMGYGNPVGGIWTSKVNPNSVVNNSVTISGPYGIGSGAHYLTYTYTDQNGCSSSDSSLLVVNDAPNIFLKDTNLCTTSGSFKLTASPSGGTWRPMDANDQKALSGQLETYFDPNIAASGKDISYHYLIYKVENTKKCSSEDTMLITVYKTPDVKAGQYGPYCEGDGGITLGGSPAGGTWKVVQGPSEGLEGDAQNGYTFYPKKAKAGDFKLLYTVSNNGHCEVSDTAFIKVNALPVVSLNMPSHLCISSAAIKVNGQPSGGSLSGSGIIGNMFDPARAGIGTHSITYTYKNPGTGCVNSISQTIEVNDTPSVEFITDPAVCEGEIFTILARFKNASGVTWMTPEGGAIIDSFTNGNIATLRFQPSLDQKINRSFAIQVKANPATGSVCTGDTGGRTFSINPMPVPAFNGSPLSGCGPLTVKFKDESTVENRRDGIVKTIWYFGDGTDSVVASNPVHTYKKAGTYTVKIAVYTDKGCRQELTKPNFVTVYLTPVVDFEAKPTFTPISLPRIRFINNTVDTISPVHYEWNFGDRNTSDGGKSELRDPEHMYSDTGKYTVRLIAVNKNGCTDTLTRINYIYIQPELLVFIPNVFSPNNLGTEYNEKFRVKASGYTSYDIRIYNRWGELMYESKDANDGWDGTYNNQTVEEGAYVYVIKATSLLGKEYKYTGTVTIIR